MIVKKIKILLIYFCLLSLFSCGFKVVDQNYLGNYKIADINIDGDNRISYILKNKLQSSKKSKQNLKEIKININVDKDKIIKEKNVQNQITKYLIQIRTKVNYEIENDLKGNFIVSESGEFNVAARHSRTLENEKELLKILIINIEEKIIDSLRSKINDI